MFKIKYQTMDVGHDKECLPVEIYPQKLTMNDYDIRYSKEEDRIYEIRHKSLGLVKFVSQKIDEECGYVSGSKLVVFTSEYKEDMLNIIHVHLNDMSEEVTLDVAYMSEGQSLKDFEEFSVDVTGQILRYKIIAKNMKIFTILYNTGKGVEELPFEEIRLNKDDYIVVKQSELSTDPLFARI